MVKEGWRERPRLGAAHASRAPRGVAHATVSRVRVGVPNWRVVARKIGARCGAPFLDVLRVLLSAQNVLRIGCRIIGANECHRLLSVHVMHLLMRECHGIRRSVIADGQDEQRYTNRPRRSLPHCLGASARVKATLRRCAALTRASRSPEWAFMGATALPDGAREASLASEPMICHRPATSSSCSRPSPGSEL
jgi:hypothetical protein